MFLFKTQKQFIFNIKKCIHFNSITNDLKKKDITITFNKNFFFTNYAYNVFFDKDKKTLNINQFKNS